MDSLGLQNQASSSNELTYDTHETYLMESSQGFGSSLEVVYAISNINDVQAFRVQTLQTSNGQRTTLIAVEDLGCEVQLSSTNEATTGVLVWCPKNRVPANSGIWNNDRVALRIFSTEGKSHSTYQASVRSTLHYRSWGLRADVQVPSPVEQITSFRIYKASYDSSSNQITAREELSDAICQSSLSSNAGYPTSQILVRCANNTPLLQAGQRIEVEYQTMAHQAASKLFTSSTQLSANISGLEAKLIVPNKLSEIKNLRAYRKIQIQNSDDTTGTYLENFHIQDCTLKAQGLDANQTRVSLSCNNNNTTLMASTDEVVFVFVKQVAPEDEMLPAGSRQINRLEFSNTPHSQSFGNL